MPLEFLNRHSEVKEQERSEKMTENLVSSSEIKNEKLGELCDPEPFVKIK